MTATVICCDDHEIVRRGVRRVLASGREFELVGEAASGAEALRLVSTKRPDVLLLDLRLPDVDGLDVLTILARTRPVSRAVILSATIENIDVVQAYRAGAAGFVTKTRRMEEVLLALREVVAGRSAFLVRKEALRFAADCIDSSACAGEAMSLRELQVLRCTGERMRTREIADKLGIDARTVEDHRRNLRRKLRLSSFPELIEYARKRRLPPEVGIE